MQPSLPKEHQFPSPAPVFCCFFIQPHSETGNRSVFLPTNGRWRHSRRSDLKPVLESELVFCSLATVLAGGKFLSLQHEKECGREEKKKKKKGVLMKVQWKSHHQRSRLSCHYQSVPGKPGWLSCYLQISLDKQVCLYLSHLPAKLSFFNLNSNKFEFNG